MPEDERNARNANSKNGSIQTEKSRSESGSGVSWEKIAGIGLVIVIVIGLVWITKP